MSGGITTGGFAHAMIKRKGEQTRMNDYTTPAIVTSYYVADLYDAANGFNSGTGIPFDTSDGKDFCKFFPYKC